MTHVFFLHVANRTIEFLPLSPPKTNDFPLSHSRVEGGEAAIRVGEQTCNSIKERRIEGAAAAAGNEIAHPAFCHQKGREE